MFSATDQFDPLAMQDFMRRPDIYWSASDAMAPPPEAMDFLDHLAATYTWTVAALWNRQIIGYVQLVRRTSIGAEIHVGFHPQFRGRVAKTFTEYVIGQAFTDQGLRKLWAIIPSDNRAALMGARLLRFREEGRLRQAMMRSDGPRDLVILSLDKEQGYAGQGS